MSELSYLMDWFEVYLRHKDVFLKKIQGVEKKDNIMNVAFKDAPKSYFFYLNLKDVQMDKVKAAQNPSIVFLNNPENLKEVLRIWPKMIEIRMLSIYSVNPFSEIDNKWILFPYTHHQVSDPESLELGLKAMAEMVQAISAEDFARKAKQQKE